MTAAVARENDFDTASTTAASREEMLSAVLPIVWTFLEHSDRLSLARANKSFKSLVDQYSEIVVQKITQTHGLDAADFMARLRERFWSQTRDRFDWAPVDTDVPPPPRCQLLAAMNTPLYQIRSVCEALTRRWGETQTFRLFPSENRIALVSGRGQRIQRLPRLHVWDLSTKQHVCTLRPFSMRQQGGTRLEAFDFKIYPQEDRIAIIYSNTLMDGPVRFETIVELWDVSTQQCLSTFAAAGIRMNKCHLSDNGLVMFSDHSLIQVWSQNVATGEFEIRLLHNFEIENGWHSLKTWSPVNDRETLTVARNYDNDGHPLDLFSVKVFDCRMGTVASEFTFDALHEENFDVDEDSLIELLVCSGKWVLILIHEAVQAGNDYISGIYVFDLETSRKVQFLRWPDYWRSMHQASDCPSTVCVTCEESSRVYVLNLDASGCLSVRFSFWPKDIEQATRRIEIVKVFRNRVLIQANGICSVYSTETGKQERSWNFGDHVYHAVVSVTRNELLYLGGDGVDVLKACCLEEPRL